MQYAAWRPGASVGASASHLGSAAFRIEGQGGHFQVAGPHVASAEKQIPVA